MRRRRAPGVRRTAREDGYIAVLTVILVPVLCALSAFTIDVGNWYAVAEKVQRAADAAALAGVTYMPGNLAAAKQQAINTAAANGYTSGVDPEPVPGAPSELRVTISQTVPNTFGKLMGVDTTTVTRTAVANYQAPLPMGSPCNGFGNGPDPVLGALPVRSSNCSSASEYWANVGSPKATKISGDAYQDGVCSPGVDGCNGSTNVDYSKEGDFYIVKVSQPVSNLTIQAFDPAFVQVGDLCTSSTLGSGYKAASYAKNSFNYRAAKTGGSTPGYIEDPALYASGQSNPYCTGDNLINGSTPPDTTYSVRAPAATSNPWDPTSYPVMATRTFDGFSGDLFTALDQYKEDSKGNVVYSGSTPQPAGSGYDPTVASEFRQWVTLATFPGTTQPGTYFVQVQTNGPDDNPNGSGHNRFALRAYGGGAADNAAISISGYTNMVIYADLPQAQTSFYVTQVSPAAAGQILNLRLYDIGDSSQPGTVTIRPPVDSGLSSFTGCTATGPTTGNLSNCSITANSSYNGKWESISVPIPKNYTCNSTSVNGCWITLSYNYGSGQPSDTTSWAANLEGTPVRLTQ